jgi:hypothetical protein
MKVGWMATTVFPDKKEFQPLWPEYFRLAGPRQPADFAPNGKS